MNIRKLAVLTSLACAVGVIYAANSFKALEDAFEFEFDDEKENDGEV